MKKPGQLRRRRGLSPSPLGSARAQIASSGLWKRTRIKRRNAARKAREFARTYESEARVRWVQAQPSVWDGAGPCINAHVGTEGKGASRKANADQIVPLTDAQHRAYDRWLPPFDTEEARERVRARCADVERAWRAHVGAAAA